MRIDENYQNKQTNKQELQKQSCRNLLIKRTIKLFVHYVVGADFATFCSRMGAST